MDAHPAENFFQRFRPPAEPGVPKYAQLRRSIIQAIERGYWRPGDKLPTELELTRLTPFSLGTVQRGLRALAAEGLIERRQGHGTFVAEPRHQMEAPLHCRFVGDDGNSTLPVYPRIVGRRRIASSGSWTAYLGGSAQVFCIERVINIGEEFSVFSAFYADAERLGSLLKNPIANLGAANFKLVMSRESQLPITEIRHSARVESFPARVSRTIGATPQTVGMVLKVAAQSGATAIYYQELYIPPNGRTLLLS